MSPTKDDDIGVSSYVCLIWRSGKTRGGMGFLTLKIFFVDCSGSMVNGGARWMAGVKLCIQQSLFTYQ